MPQPQPQRLQNLPPYLFVEIDRKRAAAKNAGRDVIDFGIGDPDRPTPQFIVQHMQAALAKPQNHRYPHDLGSESFRTAVAQFFHQRYKVDLGPKTEIIALIGSKEGLTHLPLAFINPGDVVLVPDPAYPAYAAGAIFAGAQVHPVPLDPNRGWLPDLNAIPSHIRSRAKLLYLNYPNNPTGAIATLDFYHQAVEFAKANNLIIASDAAYNETYFHQPPPSILQVPDARSVAIEFHSCSKTFNMTGWRIGFAAAGADLIAPLARVKSNIDSGAFTAVQEAAIAAYEQYDHPEVQAIRATYAERASILCEGLSHAGFKLAPPQATFYIWARPPANTDGMSAANKLLDHADVVCIPGAGFGSQGQDYVRFALTVDIDRTREATDRIRKLQW